MGVVATEKRKTMLSGEDEEEGKIFMCRKKACKCTKNFPLK